MMTVRVQHTSMICASGLQSNAGLKLGQGSSTISRSRDSSWDDEDCGW